MIDYIDFRNNENNFDKNQFVNSKCLYRADSFSNKYLITIFITVYKRVTYLYKAIESCLSQTAGCCFNVVVLDDCDTYNGVNPVLQLILDKYYDRVSYFQNEKNIGMAGTWNRCGEICETPYFAILHDDDCLKSNYIEVMEKFLNNHNNIDCVVNNIEMINYPFSSGGSVSENFNKFHLILKKLQSNVVCLDSLNANYFLDNYYGPPTCGILFKKSSFLESGGFNQDYFPSLDWFFMIYFSTNYNVYKIRESLSCYVWAENESLKENTQKLFMEQRALVISSLQKHKRSAFLGWILKKDLNNKKNNFLYTSLTYSFRFKLFRKFFSFKYGN